MNKALLFAMAATVFPLPALSQTSGDSTDRGAGRSRLDSILRDLGDDMAAAPSRGAAFLMRSGDATIAVRCDPRDSMRQCVDAATSFLDRARSSLNPGAGAAPPSRP